MKYLAALLLIATSWSLQAQTTSDAISKYFSRYVEDERFTVIYISPKMFSLFSKLDLDMEDAESEAIMEVVSDLKSLRILVCEEEGQALYEEATKTINTTEYEVLMNIRNKDQENVDFLIKDQGETINELLLLVGAPDNFVLMSFVGNIDLNKVSKLTEAFEDEEEEEEGKN